MGGFMRTAIVFAASLFAYPALAQEGAAGKYSGSYTLPNLVVIGLALDIGSIKDGVVEGQGERMVSRGNQSCAGPFRLTGTLKGDQLDVRAAEKFGRGGDCTFRLQGTLSDNKIKGKVGPNDIELTK
jgi:hypothetical protein